MVVARVVLRRTVQVVVCLHHTLVNEGVSLTDGISSLLTIGRIQAWVVALHHLIDGVRHVHVGPDAHLVGEYLVHANLQLVTVSLHLTQVHPCGALAEVSRNELRATYQNVRTAVAEDIERTGNQAAQDSVVKTEVELLHLLPVYVLVTYGSLAVEGIGRTAFCQHSGSNGIITGIHVQ